MNIFFPTFSQPSSATSPSQLSKHLEEKTGNFSSNIPIAQIIFPHSRLTTGEKTLIISLIRHMANYKVDMFQFMNITKALSDENRIRILMALHERGELCVCHLIDLLELAPSTVSKHLFLLKNARLIVVRKNGRWAHYRLNDTNAAPASVTDALAWVARSTADDPVIESDRQRLNNLLTECLHEGCRA